MRLRLVLVAFLAAAMSSVTISGRDELRDLGEGPCRRLPDIRGKAKGLHKQCSGGGSSSGVARGDFNGDGVADLAVGVPLEDIGNVRDAGAVNVIYGSATGLTVGGGSTGVPRNQFWHQNSPGVLEAAGTDDYFGWSLAAGNFNGDDYSDLAIGVPYEDIGDISNAGVVQVLFGSATGLTATDDQSWDMRDLLVDDASALDHGQFGLALAWGDFNGDAVGDLAIGRPGAQQYQPLPDIRTGFVRDYAGEVVILYGSVEGLAVFGAEILRQQSLPSSTDELPVRLLGDSAEHDDRFGSVLAAGKFDADIFTDLVVGVPFESIEATSLFAADDDFAGMIHIVYGDWNGFESPSHQRFSQAMGAVVGAAGEREFFGSALAIGDFDGNGRADLAVGTPYQSVAVLAPTGILYFREKAGSVIVFYSDANGLSDGLELWTQDSEGVQGAAEEDDLFGFALAAADFDGDGNADLAIGVPREDHSGVTNAGMVNVLYGSSSGLTAAGDQLWYQGMDPTFGTGAPQRDDLFGSSLSAWNFGNGDERDLVIGVPGKGLFGRARAGMIHVVYGSSSGLAVAGNQFWHQAHLQSDEGVETGDEFGRAIY